MGLTAVGDAPTVRRQIRHSSAGALTRQHRVPVQKALRHDGGGGPQAHRRLQPPVTLELGPQLACVEERRKHLGLRNLLEAG
eukprot:10633997-Alexandrium_andersonii.AAC.1